MTRSEPQSESPIADRLTTACERNVVVEIHVQAADGELIVLKARLLKLNDDSLELDAPQAIGQDYVLGSGARFDAHFQLDRTWFSFSSRVSSVHQEIDVNKKLTVVGVVVTRPRKLNIGQRRNDHRVVVNPDRISGTIVPAIEENDGMACSVDARPVTLDIADLSVGGLALIDLHDTLRPRLGQLYFVELDLQDDDDFPLMAMMEVRQLRKLPRGGVRAGLMLKTWPGRRHRSICEQRIQRFVTALQRQHARSRAG